MFFYSCPYIYVLSIATRAHFPGSFFSQKEDMIIQEVSQEEGRKQKEKGREGKKQKENKTKQKKPSRYSLKYSYLVNCFG